MLRVSHHHLEHRSDDLVYYEGEPFTGVGYDLADAGWLYSEIEYRDGIQWGRSRDWYAPGELAAESHFAWGWLHGPSREWHRNGQLATEELYEMGSCLKRKRWDQTGRLIEDYELKASEPEFRLLEQKRAEWSHFDWSTK